MASITMVSRFLEAADLLIAEGGKSSAFRHDRRTLATYLLFKSRP